MGSPRQTVDYLKWAFTAAPEDQKPKHLWNCLSARMIAAEGITLSDLDLFWKEIRENLQQYLGDIGGVEVVAERRSGARHCEVDVESGDHTATLALVLEASYEIRPQSRAKESISGQLPSVEDSVAFVDNEVRVAIPGVEKRIPPEEIYQIRIDNAWKIDRIVRHNLAELEAKLKGAAAGTPGP